MTLTPERLAQIRDSIPTGYEGPWQVTPGTDDQGNLVWLIGYPTDNPDAGLVATIPDYGEQLAEFMAATRTDVPDLLAEVDRLSAALAACTCPDSYETYAGPEADCPMHGAVRALNEATADIDALRQRADQVARAENLRDKWLSWPPGSEHYAAGIMLACYLDGTAYGSDEPRPATQATTAAHDHDELTRLRAAITKLADRCQQGARDNGRDYERTGGQYQHGKAMVWDHLMHELRALLEAADAPSEQP